MLLHLFAPALLALQTPAAEALPLAAHFPANTAVYLEITRPADLLDRPTFEAALARAAADGYLTEEQRMQAEGALSLAPLFIGGDPFELAGDLMAGGIALGFTPPVGGQTARGGLVLRGADPALLERLLIVALARVDSVGGAAGAAELLEHPDERVGSVDVWELERDVYLGRDGATLYAAVGRALLDALLAPELEGGLSGRPEFERASRGDVSAWIDGERITAFGGDLKDFDKRLELIHQPAVQFLLGAGLAELFTARAFELGLDFERDGVAVEFIGHAPAERTGLGPHGSAPAPRLASAATTGSAWLYRDFAGVVAARNELFAPELQPQFSKAFGELALFFGGLDLEDDMLPALGPWIEFGVAELDYATAPRPDVALPGLVAVFEVAPERQRNFQAAFQTAISLGNAERAQNGQPPYVLLLEKEGETLISAGHLPAPPPDAPVDMTFNLAPACAYADGHLVLGTHEAIVRAAIRDLTNARTPRAATPTESISVRAEPLAALFENNREFLIMQELLSKGGTRAAIEQRFDTIGRGLRLFDHARLSLDSAPTHLTLRLELELAAPLGATEARK